MFSRLFDSPSHILILVLVIVVVVGWKRLPDVARSLGRSARILKSEAEEMKKDGKAPPSAASSDTVKGETVRPTAEQTQAQAQTQAPEEQAGPITYPSGDPVDRETHKQTPA